MAKQPKGNPYRDLHYCNPSIYDYNAYYTDPSSITKTESGKTGRTSFYFPTQSEINLITTHAKNTQMKGITSIGCGTGLLEWLLTENFEPLSVCGIDVGSPLCLLPQAYWTISYGFVMPKRVACVDDNRALMFCWGDGCPWKEYIDGYGGRCVIVIGDNTCWPTVDAMHAYLDKGANADRLRRNGSASPGR